MSNDERIIHPWQELGAEVRLETRVFNAVESHARNPDDGSEHRFWRLDAPDWVNIVPVTPDDEVVLIRQYRHGNRAITLEIPGGMVDPGEDPASAAGRECLEETGYRCTSVSPLGRLAPNPALFPNTLYTFTAITEAEPGAIENDSGTEFTAVELLPVSEVAAALTDGRIDHALVVATLWHFLHRRSA